MVPCHKLFALPPAQTTEAVASDLSHNSEAIASVVLRITQDTRRRDAQCLEHRSESRLPFHRRVHVTPLCEDVESCIPLRSEPVAAYTRDISSRGVGLLHDQPLGSRRVLLTFQLLDEQTVSLVVDLKWERDMGDFWWASGGRLVAVVPTADCGSQGLLDSNHPLSES